MRLSNVAPTETGQTSTNAHEPILRVGWLLIVLVALDVALIAVNAVGATSFLNFDEERNFTTWYSSAKLLGAAVAALWCMTLEPGSQRRGAKRFVWPTVALLFVGLSMDETATAHERLAVLLMTSDEGESLRARLLGGDSAKDAFAWPVLFAPVILAILYFLVSALYSRMKQDRRSLLLGLAGCVAFVAAIVLEGPAVYFSPPIVAWGESEVARYMLFTLLEESAEVVGATLMLAALLLHARHLHRVAA